MGVFKDKEYEKVIRITAPYAAKVTAVETPGNPRALPKEELKKVCRLAKKYGSSVEIIMKSIIDLNHEPQRLWEWCRLASEIVKSY